MKKSLVFSFVFIGEIGFATAIPLVVFGLIGRYFDNRYNLSPYLFLTGILIASIQIFFYLRWLVKKASRDINKL